MFNQRIYMLQSTQYYIAVNRIDQYVILGTMDRSYRIPAIDAQLVANYQLRQELLSAIKQHYQLIVTTTHTPFLMTTLSAIKSAIDKLEHRYYMSVELFNS